MARPSYVIVTVRVGKFDPLKNQAGTVIAGVWDIRARRWACSQVFIDSCDGSGAPGKRRPTEAETQLLNKKLMEDIPAKVAARAVKDAVEYMRESYVDGNPIAAYEL